MPCAGLTAQSVKPGIQSEDSLAIVRQFVHNAKPLLDSLTALHFARLQIRFLQEQSQRHQLERDQTAQGFIQSKQQQSITLQANLLLQQQLAEERRRRRWAQLEVWAWRLGAAYLAYKKLCPSCRP